MQVINWNNFINNNLNLNKKKTSMTIGMFDGVHRGHQELIRKIVSYNTNHLPVIVTFRQNHKIIRNEENRELNNIQSFQERLKIFEKLGIMLTITVDFTDEFKKMPGIEFISILLKHGNLGFFAAGSNFRCGYQLDTNAIAIKDFLVSRGIPAEIVPEVMEGALPISSSRIRTAINDGDNNQAETMLGRTLF